MAVHSCFVVGRSEGGGREVVEGDGRGVEGRKEGSEWKLDLCLELLLLLRILSPKALLNCGSDGGWCRGWVVTGHRLVKCHSLRATSHRQSLSIILSQQYSFY
jgi:hypothetical protein